MLNIIISLRVDDATASDAPEEVSNVSMVVHTVLRALKDATPYVEGGQATIEIVNDKEN